VVQRYAAPAQTSLQDGDGSYRKQNDVIATTRIAKVKCIIKAVHYSAQFTWQD